MSYQQLSLNERQQIYTLRYEDYLSIRAIARLLNRNASTISRELYRNMCNNLLSSRHRSTDESCPTKSLETAFSKSVF